MPSLRYQITEAVRAKLATIPDAVARYLQDAGSLNENTASDTLLCVVVPGEDTITQDAVRQLHRQLTGHVIVEARADIIDVDGVEMAVMDEAARLAWDDDILAVEAALLDLADTMTIQGVTHFRMTGIEYTFDGTPAGRLGARVDWLCDYRHDTTSSAAYTITYGTP